MTLDLAPDMMTRVRYQFSSKAPDQKGWTVRSVSLTEGISRLYELTVELGAEPPAPDAMQMLGEDATLEFSRDFDTRLVHGVVERVESGESTRELTVVRVVIVPALAALEHSTRSRIFAEQTLGAVVDSVVKEALAPFGRKLDKLDLSQSDYPKREYVVQHRESDFGFIARLLAEQGLWFYFDHAGDGDVERLVVTDTTKNAPPVSESPEVQLALDRETSAHHQVIYQFGDQQEQRNTKLRVRQYNWTHPELYEEAAEEEKAPTQSEKKRPLSRYDHGDIAAFDYREPKYQKFDTKVQARLRLESQRAERHVFYGKSNVVMLQPGHFMTVDGTDYLIVSVSHSGNTVMNAGQAAHSGDYYNTFKCVLRTVPYRPLRLLKPHLPGIQTATVVNGTGVSTAPRSSGDGDDVVTDVHGRVRVKFHWDETPPNSKGTTSCWIRSSQAWAGAGWGAQFIPRVGMEVVVQFIDGDPDQPVITGCLYNGLNHPPYAKTPTQSGIRTASSVDPTRYNEIRFEDANGAEELFVKAQTTHTIQVGKDRAKTVGGSQTETIAKDKTITVQGNHTESVTGTYATTISKTETRDVTSDQTQTIGGNQTESITGSVTRSVSGPESVSIAGSLSVSVGQAKSLAVAGPLSEVSAARSSKTATSFSMEAGAAWSVSAGADASVHAKANLALDADKGMKLAAKETQSQSSKKWVVDVKEDANIKAGTKTVIDVGEQLTIKCGSAQITLKKSGEISIAGAKISIKGSGDVVIKGNNVTNN